MLSSISFLIYFIHPMTQEATPSDAETYPEIQDENCPPAGMVLLPHESRHMSGVLQPAKYIPVPQEQETQDAKRVEIEERNFAYRQANDTESLYVSICITVFIYTRLCRESS